MKFQRYVLLSFVVLGTLSGWAVNSALVSAIAQFGYSDSRIGGVLLVSTAVSAVVGLLTFIVLSRTSRSVKFADEVISELARVTWPSRDETVRAASTVVSTALFAAALIAVYDFMWKNLAQFFLFTEG